MVLFWFLAEEKKVIKILADLPPGELLQTTDMDWCLSHRQIPPDVKDTESLTRHTREWKGVLHRLYPPSSQGLRVAALACALFAEHSGFSVWQLARRSDFAYKHLIKVAQERTQTTPLTKFSFRGSTCAICKYLRFVLLLGDNY